MPANAIEHPQSEPGFVTKIGARMPQACGCPGCANLPIIRDIEREWRACQVWREAHERLEECSGLGVDPGTEGGGRRIP